MSLLYCVSSVFFFRIFFILLLRGPFFLTGSLSYWVEYYCWTTHVDQRAIAQGKPLFVETLNTLTFGTETLIEQTTSIVGKLCLLHFGCEIPQNFFMLIIFPFHHYSIIHAKV
jgi:hypothetical protein